ncbi:hypothetical protein BTH42_32165 [Burkholderia sp. SRS-W-2-2016]|uniref:hypothetical protein n=1 Tax=Burkholderia sp. SRS-W-2-2016 TaxID=1926878 RepID=UPI00094B206E|nr:hypothetical protein [Burkholderia sp. SRS-W-2-2016]OLL27501.1 hypothetical protein BTH42_32165 [Burkholderia sp. SRS-W-2-2016]
MMSGFWEAVDRAALGQPGAAAPRPRSLFEVDDARPDGLDVFDVETEAPPPRTLGESFQPASALPVPPRMERETTADAPRTAAAFVPREQTDDAQRPSENGTGRPASVTATAIAPLPAAVAPRAAPPVIERVQLHRSEVRDGVDATLLPRITEPRDTPHTLPATEPTDSAAHAPPVIVKIDPPRDHEPIPVHAQPVSPPPSSGPVRAVAEASAVPQPLVIEIDRIEIRIEPQHTPAAPAPRASNPAPAVSLDEYLTRHGAGGQ